MSATNETAGGAGTLSAGYAAGTSAASSTIAVDATRSGVSITSVNLDDVVPLTLNNTNIDLTGDEQNVLVMTGSLAVASSATTLVPLSLAYTINQTGTASGAVTGIRVKATETAVLGTHLLLDLQVGAVSRFKVAAAGSSTLLTVDATKTVASATSAVWNGTDFVAPTLTLSGNTAITTATGVNATVFRKPIISAASALTVTNASTVTIIDAPAGGGAGPATLTNAYSLWVQAGMGKFDGGIRVASSPSNGTLICDDVTGARIGYQTNQINIITSMLFSIGGSTVGQFAAATGNFLVGGASDVASTRLRVSASKTVASASGAVWDATDVIAATLTLSGSTNITTATGVNLAVFRQPTISAASALSVAAASTVYIENAPVGAGAGPATLTKKYSLWIDAGLPRIDSTSANAAVATVLGSVGPTGASTTVQEWLTVDINGVTRFIPCF